MKKSDIENILSQKDLDKKDVYLMLIDDSNNIKIFRKDER